VQQIKIFKGLENDIHGLEREINSWLKSSNAQVINMFGNVAPQTPQSSSSPTAVLGAERMSGRNFIASDILIVVLYQEK
jgi:hypothetical protein